MRGTGLAVRHGHPVDPGRSVDPSSGFDAATIVNIYAVGDLALQCQWFIALFGMPARRAGAHSCRRQFVQTTSAAAMSGPHIAVIGLGAMGSAALFQLARRGVRATGIEQFAPGHDRGSSHGPTRIIRLAHFENAAYVPLMRRAYTLWRELETAADQKLVHLTGIAEIGPADGELVRGTTGAMRQHSLTAEILDGEALMRRYPAFNIPKSFTAIVQPDGGYIEADRAVAAALRIAAAAGAQIRTGEKVLAVEPHGRGVRIKTDRDIFDADGAIVAAGPWTGNLLPDLQLPLRVTRQVVGWFEPKDAGEFSADRFPVFLLESRYGVHYGFPMYGERGVKVSKHYHLDETVAPDGYDRTVSAIDEAVIRAPLAEFLPSANGRLLSAQTCLYTMTPDETFIVDRMPGAPHIVIASPCSGHGFKFSPVIGEIVTDLATRGATDHDIARFGLRRFS
jgi:sarcosine oxidase